jgi:hypothetical protein
MREVTVSRGEDSDSQGCGHFEPRTLFGYLELRRRRIDKRQFWLKLVTVIERKQIQKKTPPYINNIKLSTHVTILLLRYIHITSKRPTESISAQTSSPRLAPQSDQSES